MIELTNDELAGVFVARCGLCDEKVPYEALALVEFPLSNDEWTERYVCDACRAQM